MYIDGDFVMNSIQPNFLSLLLTGKFPIGVTARARLKRIFTSGEYTINKCLFLLFEYSEFTDHGQNLL